MPAERNLSGLGYLVDLVQFWAPLKALRAETEGKFAEFSTLCQNHLTNCLKGKYWRSQFLKKKRTAKSMASLLSECGQHTQKLRMPLQRCGTRNQAIGIN